MNIYDQLQAVEDRYEELGELLSDPDVVSDTKRFMELSKEEALTRDTDYEIGRASCRERV